MCKEKYNHNHAHKHRHYHYHHRGDNVGAAFLINALFTIIEFFGGLFINSSAILSDAIHELSDTISLGVSWILEKNSSKGENDKYTYGYSRLSVVCSIINIIVLSVGTILILINVIPRIFNPQPVNAKGMFILAIVGVLMNGAEVLKVKNGEKISEKVISLHLLEDVLGWVAILIVSIILFFVDVPILDPLLSIGISIYIILNTIINIKTISDIILQAVPNTISLADIIKDVKNISKDILDVKNVKCWSLDGESNVITLELNLKNIDSFLSLKSRTEELLKEKYNAKYTTISINYLEG